VKLIRVCGSKWRPAQMPRPSLYYILGGVHKGTWTLKPVFGLRKKGSLLVPRRNLRIGPSDLNREKVKLW
jgi:hypothetical protein